MIFELYKSYNVHSWLVKNNDSLKKKSFVTDRRETKKLNVPEESLNHICKIEYKIIVMFVCPLFKMATGKTLGK